MTTFFFSFGFPYFKLHSFLVRPLIPAMNRHVFYGFVFLGLSSNPSIFSRTPVLLREMFLAFFVFETRALVLLEVDD